jgi:hypothetical protein
VFNKLKSTVARLFGFGPLGMEQQPYYAPDHDPLWDSAPAKPESPVQQCLPVPGPGTVVRVDGAQKETAMSLTEYLMITNAARRKNSTAGIIQAKAPRADRRCKGRGVRISVNDVNAFQLLSNEYADTAEALLLNGLVEGQQLFSRQLGRYLTSKGKKVAQPERSMSRVKKALRRSCLDLQVQRFRKGKRYSLTACQRAALTEGR